MTNDEKMLKKAKDNLERIRREYTGDQLKHLESAAMAMVEVYEKKVQEGRIASGRPNKPSETVAG